MIDPRREAVLTRAHKREPFRDKTNEAIRWAKKGQSGTTVVFDRGAGPKEYTYRDPDKLLVLENPVSLPLAEDSMIEVRGKLWSNVTGLLRFDHPAGAWIRAFYRTGNGETYRTYPAEDVRFLNDAANAPRPAGILQYWHDLVAQLPNLGGSTHPLVRAYGTLNTIHPDSALARYLAGSPIHEERDERLPIFPFSSNLSQREALLQSLRYPISVIDGPPGTGKTQTILNVLATLSATPGVRVGVVSANNAAVDNVRDKLTELGFGYIVAGLGRREKKEAFFGAQCERNAAVEQFLGCQELDSEDTGGSAREQLLEIEDQIIRLQADERKLAELRQSLDRHRLEYRHFTRYLEGHEVADLDGVPLLRRDPDRILDYLVESQFAANQLVWPLRWVRRLRWLIKFGPLKGVDPNDSGVVLQLQRAYYVRRIEELTREVAELESRLFDADLKGLVARQRDISLNFFRTGLRKRYSSVKRKVYDEQNYLQELDSFSVDYPIILSTCHSLRRSVGDKRLLDYLIIDEASQVDLLAAGLALASTKRVIVVGDLAQLPHIPEREAAEKAIASPLEAYDYEKHSLLSSLQELYGDSLPRTRLREHYRCDPAIIGFCNEKFYDRQLIPFAASKPGRRPLVLHTTAEGNHMRTHREGGRSNQREIDVIEQEVIPQHCEDIPRDQIGVTSPYRTQITKIDSLLVADLEEVEADTVHRFQGREKKVVIMSTVLDDTWRGRSGTQFVDDPRLVNVAVSRAQEKFVLVTNHEMLPTSRNLRDLMEYVLYHDPEYKPQRSAVVSVFDLLYQHYSERLKPMAARLRGQMKYRPEDIVWTTLQGLLGEEPYRDLEVLPQIIVQNLLPDLDGLTPEEATYVKNRCSLDFVIYRRVTHKPVLAIEVNGFAFHENMPDQRAKDLLKKSIMDKAGIPLLPLPTTGSGEERLIRTALDAAVERLA